MKIINKKPIPKQICKCCGAEVEIDYKDLKYNGMAMANTDWRCPLCKTTQNVLFMSIEELKEKLVPNWVKIEDALLNAIVEDLPKERVVKNQV